VLAVLTSAAMVMIVDDERHLREGLAELFTAEGYQVIQASNGDEALVLLAQAATYPDVVFLDLKMPCRDGIATLRALKAAPETHRIAVVIITAYGGSEQTITAMKIGAYDYITKPFDPDEVLRTASRAVEVSYLNREVERLRAETQTEWDEESIGLMGHHPTMRERLMTRLWHRIARPFSPAFRRWKTIWRRCASSRPRRRCRMRP
jgi:DNA-binding NtrC family response regulator